MPEQDKKITQPPIQTPEPAIVIQAPITASGLPYIASMNLNVKNSINGRPEKIITETKDK